MEVHCFRPKIWSRNSINETFKTKQDPELFYVLVDQLPAKGTSISKDEIAKS